MSETCRLRRGEGYGACDDEASEKTPSGVGAGTAIGENGMQRK